MWTKAGSVLPTCIVCCSFLFFVPASVTLQDFGLVCVPHVPLLPCISHCRGSVPGAGNEKRQRLELAQGKSFKLLCFGIKFTKLPQPTFDFMVDCRRFVAIGNPHCGFHDELIETYVKNDLFQRLMREVLHFVQDRKEGQATIAVFSDNGQHRSVVSAWALEKLICHMGFKVSVEFLEHQQGNWSEICTTCAKCALESPFKKGVIERLPVWFDL